MIFKAGGDGTPGKREGQRLIWHQDWAEGEVIQTEDGVFLQTDGQGQALLAGVILDHPIRLDRQALEVVLQIVSLSALRTIQFRLYPQADDLSRYVVLPLFFLGDPEANFLQEGEWSPIRLSLASADFCGLTASECQVGMPYLRVMVEDKGDRQAVGVYIRSITAVSHPQRGCVSLHFDDGYWHHGQKVAQLLRDYSTPKVSLRGTAFLMPRQLGYPGHLSLEDGQRLNQDYGWEIGAHHSQPLTTMTPEELIREMDYILQIFQDQGWATGPVHFAYPLGKTNQYCRQALGRYFASGRLIAGGPETLPPVDWYRLRAINVTPLLPAKELALLAHQAIHQGAWAIYMFHHLVERPKLLTEYSWAEFETFLAFLRNHRYETTSIQELYL